MVSIVQKFYDRFRKRQALPLRCKRCGRILTDDKSIERGYGHDCWEKVEKEQKAFVAGPPHLSPYGILPPSGALPLFVPGTYRELTNEEKRRMSNLANGIHECKPDGIAGPESVSERNTGAVGPVEAAPAEGPPGYTCNTGPRYSDFENGVVLFHQDEVDYHKRMIEYAEKSIEQYKKSAEEAKIRIIVCESVIKEEMERIYYHNSELPKAEGLLRLAEAKYEQEHNAHRITGAASLPGDKGWRPVDRDDPRWGEPGLLTDGEGNYGRCATGGTYLPDEPMEEVHGDPWSEAQEQSAIFNELLGQAEFEASGPEGDEGIGLTE